MITAYNGVVELIKQTNQKVYMKSLPNENC